MNLSSGMSDQLKDGLSQKTTWISDEVWPIIRQDFEVDFTLKQIRIILRKLNIAFGKPFTRDYRRL